MVYLPMTYPTKKMPLVLDPTIILAMTNVQYSGARPAKMPKTTWRTSEKKKTGRRPNRSDRSPKTMEPNIIPTMNKF